jgi:2-methylaconitate cis-trans-isomerase PrpF
MIAHIAYGEGSPCPTLVLNKDLLPADIVETRAILPVVRQWLISSGAGHILKIALVAPSKHPLFDLDYRFVQCVPGGADQFEFRGSCGHSILASVMVADEQGWCPRLTPGSRVRVRVLNNGDQIACEVDEVHRRSARFTVYFVQPPQRRLADLLLTGRIIDQITTGSGVQRSSLVSLGNPYVFVDAAEVGITTREQLLAAGETLFNRMTDIRMAAAELLCWPPEGTFPKIAVVGAFAPGRLTARAISVPRWHPTLALTGATCLGGAVCIAGTVPHQLAMAVGSTPEHIAIETPGGSTTVSCATTGNSADDQLSWVAVSNKSARLIGTVAIKPLYDYLLKETEKCLPLSA